MTPKEMAIQIVDKHRTTIRKADIYGYLLSDDEIYLAKESALITVDEILKVVSFYNDSQAEVIYFKEVRKEIEKL